MIIFSSFCIPVSALKVNSLEIRGTRGEIWDLYGSGRRFTTTPFEDYNLGICYPFDIYGLNFDVTGSPLATYTYFSTYGVNYGTLTLSYYADNGNIYYDSFNGLYDLNGNKLASFVVNDGIYTLSYTGDMLSEFLLQGYFTYDNGDSELYVIADITFTPTNGDIINNQNENTDKIIGSQNQNSQAIQNNQDKNTDKITQNDDENTDKIINNQNQLQENEKNEANSSGNSASDDLSSAVPDKSAGFTSALSSFVQSMSTTDTKCEIGIPAFIIPKIDGLLPEAKLLDEQKLDFSIAISLIPEAIMKLVQALTTIALIVFSFKELYSTIEYVLTLRRGGSE